MRRLNPSEKVSLISFGIKQVDKNPLLLAKTIETCLCESRKKPKSVLTGKQDTHQSNRMRVNRDVYDIMRFFQSAQTDFLFQFFAPS